MLQGNHEIWMDNFVEKYPYMKDYTFPKACRIKERGYKYYEYNVPLKLERLTFFMVLMQLRTMLKTSRDIWSQYYVRPYT